MQVFDADSSRTVRMAGGHAQRDHGGTGGRARTQGQETDDERSIT